MWRPSYVRYVSLVYALQLNVVNLLSLLQVDTVSLEL